MTVVVVMSMECSLQVTGAPPTRHLVSLQDRKSVGGFTRTTEMDKWRREAGGGRGIHCTPYPPVLEQLAANSREISGSTGNELVLRLDGFWRQHAIGVPGRASQPLPHPKQILSRKTCAQTTYSIHTRSLLVSRLLIPPRFPHRKNKKREKKKHKDEKGRRYISNHAHRITHHTHVASSQTAASSSKQAASKQQEPQAVQQERERERRYAHTHTHTIFSRGKSAPRGAYLALSPSATDAAGRGRLLGYEGPRTTTPASLSFCACFFSTTAAASTSLHLDNCSPPEIRFRSDSITKKKKGGGASSSQTVESNVTRSNV